VIVTSHRSGPLGDVGRHLGSRRGEQLLGRIADRAALCIGVSDEIDAEFADRGIAAGRRRVVRNGVDTDRFRPPTDAERAGLRAGLDLPGDAVITVFVGRLMPEKRIGLLLDVWPDVVAAHPDAHLAVVGAGDLEDVLRARRPQQVTFAGAVLDSAPWLRAADVFVLPSAAEGLSNALLEAQACGLATVLTDVGAARDVVTDGRDGLVVPVDDAEALRAALLAVYDAPDTRARLGAAARANAVERFSIDATVAAFLAAYQQVDPR
jgi:glycosyltransferase involved in cell wall biosynthesis